MGVRGSICESDFMVGAGAPGGVSAPWACRLSVAVRAAKVRRNKTLFFVVLPFLEMLSRLFQIRCTKASVKRHFD